MVHIFLQKCINNTQRIGIRGRIKIQGSAKEMFCRITHKKLLCRCCISTDIKKYTMYTKWCADQGIFDGTRFVSMFISHFVSIFPKFIIITFHLFIAYINSCVEARKINIDPVWILGLVSEKCCIPQDVSIYRVFK